MAYDRYENSRGRWSDSDREQASRDERGFFERAGDEIASWFGDDEAERRRRHDEGMSRDRALDRDRDFDRDRGRYAYRGSSQDRERGRWDEERWSDREPRASAAGNRARDGGFSQRRYGFGAGNDSGYGSGGYGFERERGHDRHYQEWRRRQLDDLDRDYDEFRRENQQRFESEFGQWREQRQKKRGLLSQVREHMDVVGSDGEAIGKVDCVKGDMIVLTKSDSDDNRHHGIKCTMVDSVEGEQVRLTIAAEEAKSRWNELDRESAMFRRDRDQEGEVSLERSFSGTYR